ncbi:Ribosomal RNA small subunit methyltransferase A [Roseimaritima multifibrata]|uniref:Ribosomal RNA small subunit methyltransferase A n=1 Tax=Roseimaritima multifibrata TaxID=1930274 RepID=A0A517MGZ8_9BACT|nr:rRNA adenine N-6-methyltransferase family protein [Roseimaritima multifibrata]QDS94158.1 Ribosomal RNA small subunit methyltransferase A [Roseimaritima multifibrata]
MIDHAETHEGRDYWSRSIAVLKESLRHPTQVASIIPSSHFLTRTIADRDVVREATKIVDLGPGTGGTTEELLWQAAADCRVLTIEKTAGFIAPLKAINDPRLTVVEGDAVNLPDILASNDFESPDVIVSGIPFSALPPRSSQSIMLAIYQALSDSGTFIAYQLRNDVTKYADPHFGAPTVQSVLRNFPPLRVFTWRKSGV